MRATPGSGNHGLASASSAHQHSGGCQGHTAARTDYGELVRGALAGELSASSQLAGQYSDALCGRGRKQARASTPTPPGISTTREISCPKACTWCIGHDLL